MFSNIINAIDSLINLSSVQRVNSSNSNVSSKLVKPRKQAMSSDAEYVEVFDINHEAQGLSERLAKGGEGEIYSLIQRPDIYVKRYFDQKLANDGRYLNRKIEAMRELKHKFEKLNASWPALSVYERDKTWVGYAMKKVEGTTFATLAHPLLYKRHAPELDRQKLTALLLDWLKKIKKLHASGVMIGDYNLQNFMWNPNDLTAGFIDCDSYQIDINRQHYPCLVGSPDLTPPEHHNKSFKEIKRTKESEYFSIAIVLFKCFMLGRHPYDIIGGADPVDNLRGGRFPYGIGNNGFQTIPKGNWYNIWIHMSYKMKKLFIKTFTEGARNPNERATIQEWEEVLRHYHRSLGKGHHELDMEPDYPKPSKQDQEF